MMADNDPTQVAADPDHDGNRPSLLARIKVAAFVFVVILVECLIAYLYVPSRAQIAAAAQQKIAARHQTVDDAEEDQENQKKPTKEVDLEEFSVTAYQPVSNTTLRIDFHLYATIFHEDESDYNKRIQLNRHRIREQIIVIIRSSEVTDLTDAGLGLIKRKILEKTNRSLGKSLLRSVVFSDFSFLEQ